MGDGAAVGKSRGTRAISSMKSGGSSQEIGRVGKNPAANYKGSSLKKWETRRIVWLDTINTTRVIHYTCGMIGQPLQDTANMEYGICIF